MARKRYNGLTTTLGAGLLSSDTTITFAAALTSASGAVPTLTAGDYVPLVVAGDTTEVVHLTAYTSGATTGTISRGKEGTAAAAHATGTTVTNGPTVNDSARTMGVAAHLTSATSATSGTGLMVPLTAETFDTDGFHDTATNNSRVTVPVGGEGVYAISGQVTYASNATGYRQAVITKNGATSGVTTVVPGAAAQRVSVAAVMFLTEGDYVELRAFQDSGSSLALDTTGLTFLTVARISS